MPEIWIPYGSVEVAVSLKAENLAKVINPKYQFMSENSIKETLSKVKAEGRTCIFLPKPSNASIDIISRLVVEIVGSGLKPIDITVLTTKDYVTKLRRTFGANQVTVSEIEAPDTTV